MKLTELEDAAIYSGLVAERFGLAFAGISDIVEKLNEIHIFATFWDRGAGMDYPRVMNIKGKPQKVGLETWKIGNLTIRPIDINRNEAYLMAGISEYFKQGPERHKQALEYLRKV